MDTCQMEGTVVRHSLVLQDHNPTALLYHWDGCHCVLVGVPPPEFVLGGVSAVGVGSHSAVSFTVLPLFDHPKFVLHVISKSFFV